MAKRINIVKHYAEDGTSVTLGEVEVTNPDFTVDEAKAILESCWDEFKATESDSDTEFMEWLDREGDFKVIPQAESPFTTLTVY